ncbi:MAG: aminotransferase class I/II-fold pyridoxal phosphate-dependent enzyme, partial [Clostridia bacterium]|nr:aminotransferase class I/II-fold pyridoxal phosphate-dependent enzyme [Clostridia bacterium]
RLHMPGHKGKAFLGFEKADITEINGADVLYSPDGIIEESENNASSLFGTRHTFYSTEGSSLCIRAMLFLACQKEERPLILASRNVHKAFIYAAALCNCEVSWIFSKETSHLCSCEISEEDVRKAIEKADRKPSAVYVTSPDYLGNILDIKSTSTVCGEYGVPLLVDNAHGAYLNFLPENQHPIHLGASMCCDSAHKTLPVLTGGAYMHISENAPEHFCSNARSALSLFASTSPSYILLQSLDMCNAYISAGYKERLSETIVRVDFLKEFLKEKGFCLIGKEKLKITVDALSYGYTGNELYEILKNENIFCEFYDRDFLVMMFTPENSAEEFQRIRSAFACIEKRVPIDSEKLQLREKPTKALSIREAVFSSSETVKTENSIGRICASVTVSCPPAVPISVSGEIITEETVKLLKYYNINKIEVIK